MSHAEIDFALAVSGNPTTRPLQDTSTNQNAGKQSLCDFCHTSHPKLKTCSNCRSVNYCSPQCQKEHKGKCKKIRISRGIMENTPEADAMPPGKSTRQNNSNSSHPSYEWDLNTWQHSKPALFNKDKGVGCMQGETTICTIKPLTDVSPTCSIQLLKVRSLIGIGVCTKRNGKMNEMWKFNSNGSKFAAREGQVRPYGRSFGAGDVITVRIQNDNLEFDVNESCCGVAFTGFTASNGPYYVRIHLTNRLEDKMEHERTVVRRFGRGGMSKPALAAMLQNIGSPTKSEPKLPRSEAEIIS